jgi:hypothetical protein
LKNEFPTQGTLWEKLQTSLEQETVSVESCKELLDFVFDPAKGQKRVTKFVFYCNLLSEDVTDQQSFNALRILYAASKCDSVWLGDMMKHIIINEIPMSICLEGKKAQGLNFLERVNFCEEVLKDWSNNFGSSRDFDLSKELHLSYLYWVGDMDKIKHNI